MNILYIHVNKDTGRISVDDEPDFTLSPEEVEIYEVDESFVLTVDLRAMSNNLYISDLIEDDERAEKIYGWGE